MSKQPFLIFFLAFICGILLEEFNLIPLNLLIFLFGVLFILILSIVIKAVILIKLRAVFLSLLFIALGAVLHSFYTAKPVLPQLKSSEELIFWMDKKLNSTEKNRRYMVKFKVDKQKLNAVLSVPKDQPELDFRHAYKAKVLINKPFSTSNNFQFDYAKYLARQDTYYQLFLPGNYEIADRHHLSIAERIKQHRFHLLQRIDRSTLDFSSKNFLKGIILADRTEMGQVAVQDFNRSGLMHFLAISGTHVVIIFWVISLVLERIIPIRYRRFSVLSSLIFIWMFSLYIGFGNSVLRACIMISMYYIYILLQRKPDMLHSLSLAGMTILFLDTRQLFDIGFQLSFVAVFGIYWMNSAIKKFLPFPKNRLQSVFVNAFSMSTAAQLVTVPFVLFYFHQFSWMSLPANLLIVPLSEIVIVSSFVMTLLLSLNYYVPLLFGIYNEVVQILLKIIHWFADQEVAFYKNIPMSFVEVVICFGIFYFLRFLLQKFSIKNVLTFSSLVILFLSFRLVLNQYHESQSEILAVNYFKNEIVIEKNRKKVKVYFHPKIEISALQKNIVDPYLSSRRAGEAELIPIENGEVMVKGKRVVFSDSY